MRRRDFITLVGGGVAWPLAGRAQPAMPVIGFLDPETLASRAHLVAALRRGLDEMGYVEGRNIAIDYRWGESQFDRLPRLAAGLAERNVAVIVTGGGTASVAAKNATTTIPVVAYFGSDPVELGLLTSFNHPGGNITGVSPLSPLLEAKRLELLHAWLPEVSVIAALVFGGGVREDISRLQDAAQKMAKQVLVLRVGNDHDIETAYETMKREGVGALMVGSGAFLNSRRAKIIALSARHRVPTTYARREDVEAGGLMSYGGSQTDAFRQVGVYVGRVIKGETPGDLPVVQPTKFELLLNLKTAKALGLAVPPTLLALADEVIE